MEWQRAEGALVEIQALKPEMTAEKLAKYHTDASGDLSEAEYHAWKGAKKKPGRAPPRPGTRLPGNGAEAPGALRRGLLQNEERRGAF